MSSKFQEYMKRYLADNKIPQGNMLMVIEALEAGYSEGWMGCLKMYFPKLDVCSGDNYSLPVENGGE